MRRTAALATATALGLAILSPAGISPHAASFAAPMCRGEVATIVGNGGGDIVGTEGRDVVVTNRSQRVDTLGGDDLVCVTGPDNPSHNSYNPVEVHTGPGSDVVDGTAARSWPVEGELGPGADVFFGGAGRDRVEAGASDAPDYSHQDSEVDVLQPGGGDDVITSGTSGLANSDVVDLGDGRDFLRWSGTWSVTASVTGGPDADSLNVAVTSGDTSLDVPEGAIEDDGTPVVRFSELESFTLWTADQLDVSVSVRGSTAGDTVDIWGYQPTRSVTADLGDGDDVLSMLIAPLTSNEMKGGPGRDRLELGSWKQGVDFDLAGGTLSVGDVQYPATQWEDALLMAPAVTMSGTASANELAAVACRATLRGRAGDDTLFYTIDNDWQGYAFSCPKRLTAIGGPGDDEFSGSPGDDRMTGGAGSDGFRGGRGNDTIAGGAGVDFADGTGGYDVDMDLYGGGPGKDTITGGAGADLLDGDSGADVIRGGSGRDRLAGGGGGDVLAGGPARDRTDGGGGRDRCVAERERRCER